nr:MULTISPECIES: DUF4158 domain-containing protein [Mesorhizobium]
MTDYLAAQLGIDARPLPPLCTSGTDALRSQPIVDGLPGLRTASRDDRRAALLAAIDVAANGDHGLPIATAVIAEFRKRNALLPSLHSIEKIGLGGRAIARRRAEKELVEGIPPDRLTRAVSTTGQVQPAMDDPLIAKKHTYWESNGQVTRHVRVT